MRVEPFLLAILMYLPTGALCKCNSHILKIYQTVGHSYEYMTGIEVTKNVSVLNTQSVKKQYLIHGCDLSEPWNSQQNQVVYPNWDEKLDKTNIWVFCPNGYFLQGFYNGASLNGLISNIENGRCAKPEKHPHSYGDCYNQEIANCLKQKTLCKCKDDYYATGLYKPDCNEFECIGALRCCKMAEKPVDLVELSNVKTYVMDSTMVSIANLAHHLGYGNCVGCRGLNIGEGFIRDGDTWLADQSRGCEGHKHNQRLAMIYNDWGFLLKDVKYDEPILEELKPETVDSGTVYNDDHSEVQKSIQRTETSVRSVKHTATSSWKSGVELGLTVSYEPISSLTLSGSYKFNYESSQSTTDEKGSQQTHAMTVSTKKTLRPNTRATWHLTMSKARTTVTYTATVKMKFSVELQGFLRPAENNYHLKYRESGDEPTVNFKLGNQSVPFYTALKQDADLRKEPWLWYDLAYANSDARKRINDLTTESYYEMKLTGKFEDVIGKQINIYWGAIYSNNTLPPKLSP